MTIIGRGWKSKTIKAINFTIKREAMLNMPHDEYDNIHFSMYINDLPPRQDGKPDCDYIIKPDQRRVPGDIF